MADPRGRLLRPEDARLYFEQDAQAPEASEIAGGEAAVFSARCPGKQTPNEDAAALIPLDAERAVLAVADGLGGAPGGEQASRVAVEALWTALSRAPRDAASLQSAILSGFDAANQAVAALGLGAATTLAAVEIQRGLARPYHVGDSTVLVTGQRGRIKLQTVSHSPVGFAVEAGVLGEREAMHHEDRHLVSNVIGARDMRIEVGSAVELAAYDTLVLASDGLLDNLETREIAERVRAGSLERAARRLAEDSLGRMERAREGRPSKPDDVTFVVFRRGRGA
jgi:serine/threonine protein phosphatase PrpC